MQTGLYLFPPYLTFGGYAAKRNPTTSNSGQSTLFLVVVVRVGSSLFVSDPVIFNFVSKIFGFFYKT